MTERVMNRPGPRHAMGGSGVSKSPVGRLCAEIDGVKLVMADDHKGLRAAARRVFSATHQQCRVHWTRNLR